MRGQNPTDPDEIASSRMERTWQPDIPAVVDGHPSAPDAASLFLLHYLELVRLARLLLDDRESAEDVVQDVFAAMQSRWREFTNAESALRYLRTSVVNRSRSALRRRLLRHRAQPIDDTPVRAAEESALQRWENARVREAITHLPRRQREVIVLRYFENLTVAQTAEVLKISPGAVKASASRGLDSIEQALARSR